MSIENSDVILNIYNLALTPEESQANARAIGILERVLRPMGMGSYHTSITFQDYSYSFAAVAGITKTAAHNEPLPPNATFHESINLGRCTLSTRGEFNQLVNNLRLTFHGKSYHLANRNCNHFTETFATALTMGDRLIDGKPKKLRNYPPWVNRLAKTGTSLGLDGGDVCNVWDEARKAAGADVKVKHDLSSSSNDAAKRTVDESKTKKKELTEKQRAALAKLKRSK